MKTATEKQILVPHIRWQIPTDLPEVLAIENASFDYPWREEDFRRVLLARNCIGMVVETPPRPNGDWDDAKVIGYFAYELNKDHLHILKLAVDPGYRRRGVAAAILAKLKSKLSSHRRNHITLEVAEGNLTAQLFFRSQKFLATEALRGFYEDSGQDGYRMEYVLGE